MIDINYDFSSGSQIVSSTFEEISKVLAYLESSGYTDYRRINHHITTPERIAEYTKYLPLLDLASKDLPVVDWGCQFCHVSFILKALGFTSIIPYCIEDDFEEVKSVMKKFFPTSYCIGTSSTILPFKDSSIGTFISSGVFEHIQEFGVSPSEMLSEIYRVLTPGGLFIVWKLPNVSGLSEIKSDILSHWSHEFRYTLRGFLRITSASGFDCLISGSEGLLPLRLAAFLRKYSITSWFEKLFFRLSCRHPFTVFANDHYFVLKKPLN
jgi:SAM-dependent methyltransferase